MVAFVFVACVGVGLRGFAGSMLVLVVFALCVMVIYVCFVVWVSARVWVWLRVDCVV